MPTPPDPEGTPSATDAPPTAEPFHVGGQAVEGSALITALVHFYRGELGRSNIWRTRLDATTNWAVITTGAALTFAFGGAYNPHVVLLIIAALVLLFLFIEARRYRYYELWTHRIRIMETRFFAGLFDPTRPPDPGWTSQLVENLRNPTFPISLLEALGRRYRRTYALLFLILAASWVLKIAIHPTPARNLGEMIQRAHIGPLPGWAVVVLWLAGNLALMTMGLFTVGLRESEAEVFGEAPRSYLRLMARLRAATREALEVDLTSFKPPFTEGRKHVALIVTAKPREVGRALLEQLDRGVTLMRGEGMFTGAEQGVLLCVVQGRQVEQLKDNVHHLDPDAFVVITTARDVRGSGFRPLEA